MLTPLGTLIAYAAAQQEAAPRALWELMLVVFGAVATTGAALTIIWKVVRPHVDRYVRTIVEPLAANLRDVHREVSPDEGGAASLSGRAEVAADAAARVDRKLEGISATLHKMGRRLEATEGRVMVTQSVLGQHVTESRQYLGRAVDALREQGIELPTGRPPGDEEENDDGS